MNKQILADYYEHNYLIKKAKRLRNHKSLILFGWYCQYTYHLNTKYNYGHEKGNAWWFLYGKSYDYKTGNGSYYR